MSLWYRICFILQRLQANQAPQMRSIRKFVSWVFLGLLMLAVVTPGAALETKMFLLDEGNLIAAQTFTRFIFSFSLP